MVFISRPRPAWHRSAREATTQRQRSLLTGTKRGQRCHHHFRCWFRESCRGQHSAAEIEHFKQFETQAVQLDLPYCRAGVCHHEGCTHPPQQTQPSMQSVQAADNETFHDALLIPHTRRRHWSEHAAIYPISSAKDAAKFNKEAPIRICIPTYWLQG